MPSLPIVAADDFDALASALSGPGACLLDGLPDAGATDALRADLLRLRAEGALAPAAVGHGPARTLDRGIRGDSTLWLDDPRCGTAAAAQLRALGRLRDALNRRLFLGLRSLEAHYALYPPGSGYARHCDRFRDSDARVISLVSYLNPGWVDSDGGRLRLHLPDGGFADVAPRGGSTVCFLSELEHEVLPATRERASIAAWLRRDAP